MRKSNAERGWFSNDGLRWSPLDDQRLYRLLMSGYTPSRLSIRLKRTEASIWRRLRKLGWKMRDLRAGEMSVPQFHMTAAIRHQMKLAPGQYDRSEAVGQVCAKLREGVKLRHACKELRIPRPAVSRWCREDPAIQAMIAEAKGPSRVQSQDDE